LDRTNKATVSTQAFTTNKNHLEPNESFDEHASNKSPSNLEKRRNE
jgi:hypothetical protein